MNGHEKIIAMRQAGKAPKIVFLNDYPCNTDWFENGDHATVFISQLDDPKTLDLRFLVGLTVSATGSTVKRAQELFEASKQAGAKTVAATDFKPFAKNRFETTWCEVYRG